MAVWYEKLVLCDPTTTGAKATASSFSPAATLIIDIIKPITYTGLHSIMEKAFPVHIRDVGMSWATATIWCFNFIISFTWPSLQRTFTTQGAFGWYAAWCVVLCVLILLFIPETKALTLEELDQVFSVSTRKQAHELPDQEYDLAFQDLGLAREVGATHCLRCIATLTS